MAPIILTDEDGKEKCSTFDDLVISSYKMMLLRHVLPLICIATLVNGLATVVYGPQSRELLLLTESTLGVFVRLGLGKDVGISCMDPIMQLVTRMNNQEW
jgi:hypothetical protein